MTIGLSLIVKNEADKLPNLLASIEGAFDYIVLVDTGSDDDTIHLFRQWCENNGQANYIGNFEWIKDFGAARRRADELMMGRFAPDWICWADADDIIVNAQNLRNIAAGAQPDVAGLVFGYDYAQHPETGSCVCHLKRERLVRSGKGNWQGRVHEAQTVDGPIQYVPDAVAHWKHNKLVSTADEAAALRSNTRNLDILEAWVEDEPDNGRVLAYVGVENAARGNHERAIEFYRRYIDSHSTWDEERAQVYRRLCASLMALGRSEECIPLALEALGVLPDWPDTWITLAECYLEKGDAQRALHWAQQAATKGVPDTLLIINPLDYTFHAWELVARAYGVNGQFDEAVQAAEQALQHFPEHVLAMLMYEWKSALKRNRTAETYVMCAQQLISHDEQAKALILLEQCVPYFATDHPSVVQIRSFVRQRLMWVNDPDLFAAHYAEGGNKPEDWVEDEDAVCGVLPRCSFLRDGIREQIEATVNA